MPSIARRLHRPRSSLEGRGRVAERDLRDRAAGRRPGRRRARRPGSGLPGLRLQAGRRTARPAATTSRRIRNQSKLWFNDGRWWGILFDKTGSATNGTLPDPEPEHGDPDLDDRRDRDPGRQAGEPRGADASGTAPTCGSSRRTTRARTCPPMATCASTSTPITARPEDVQPGRLDPGSLNNYDVDRQGRHRCGDHRQGAERADLGCLHAGRSVAGDHVPRQGGFVHDLGGDDLECPSDRRPVAPRS